MSTVINNDNISSSNDNKLLILASMVSRLVADAIPEIWTGTLYPRWALFLSSPNTVRRILEISMDVLHGLNIPPCVLLDVKPEEFVYFFRNTMNQNFNLVTPLSNPDPLEMSITIARNISASIHSFIVNRTKFDKFLQDGIPAGLELPALTAYKEKGRSCNFGEYNSTFSIEKHHQDFHLKMSQLPQRKISLRASHHNHSDILDPHKFT